LDAPEYHEGPLDFRSAAETAARLVWQLLPEANGKQLAPIFNINLPYRPNGDYAGVMLTRQGVRIYRDVLEKRLDPRGRPYYWIAGDPPSGLKENGTDFGALQEGYVSITPLKMDMTDFAALEKLRDVRL
jgi:5'-nucleotidase